MNIKNLVKSSSLASVVAVLCISLTVFPMVGCSSQVIAANLVATLGNTVTAVETIEGNTAVSNTINLDTQAAVTAIQNWQVGTPTQDIDQALNLVLNDLKLVPISVSTTDQALIALGISTVEELLTDYTPVASGAFNAENVKVVNVSNAKLKTLNKNFKAHVNDIVAHDPSRASLKL
jgi:alpha-L-arabinofuranosidase